MNFTIPYLSHCVCVGPEKREHILNIPNTWFSLPFIWLCSTKCALAFGCVLFLSILRPTINFTSISVTENYISSFFWCTLIFIWCFTFLSHFQFRCHFMYACCPSVHTHTHNTTIIFFTGSRKLLQASIRANKTGHFIWVASDSWGAKSHPVREQEYAAVNTITVLPQRTNLDGKFILREYYFVYVQRLWFCLSLIPTILALRICRVWRARKTILYAPINIFLTAWRWQEIVPREKRIIWRFKCA